MGSRNPEKEMLKHHVAFDTYLKLCETTVGSSKPSLKKLCDLRVKLEDSFVQFSQSYYFYKSDVLEKNCETEEAFNGVVDGQPAFKFNDDWSNKHMTDYVRVSDCVNDKIEELEQSSTPEDIKPAVTNSDFLATEISSETSSLTQGVDSFVDQLNDYEEVSVATSEAMEKHCTKLRKRIESLALKAREADNKLIKQVNDSCNLLTVKLDSCMLLMCSKLEATTAALPSITATTLPKEQVHLEKSRPPKFTGDIVDYPEFKRKWLSLVSKANLPEESEVDKLRDAIPFDAKDQLYGVKTMGKSWEILDKRFGNSRLIASKLKSQLKSIQSEGKSDPEKVISLTIKVRTIVTKLEALKMDSALEHDCEYLAAVYCALPSTEQRKWLELEKSDNHWSDMLKFIEKAYDQATEELSLLATYSVDKKNKNLGKTFATDIKKHDGSSYGAEGDKKLQARKKAEDFCGKCPVCNAHHTWVRRGGDNWPSDRLLSCKKFSDMSITARAKTVEKYKGCPRCTSWNHTRDKCRMPANSCGKDDSSGRKCAGDHSRLLCGSGVPYCAAAKFKKGLSSAKEINDAFERIDEDAETVPYLQDIKVKGATEPARVFWDNGSTRVLIRDEYATEQNLMRKEVKFSLEVVGSVQERTGFIYLLDLVDMYGGEHRIWGYGIDQIMLSSVPDLTCLDSVFPHVPAGVFKAMREKEVDVLIGLNMNNIFPSGGSGVDNKDGIRVKRSLFGLGWCIGGVLDSGAIPVTAESNTVSSQAALVRSAKISIVPQPPITPDFWETDQMGVAVPARCDRCRRCQQVGSCSESHGMHTLKAQSELELIKANMKLENGEIWCNYPFIKDPKCLSFNREAAVRVAEKVWRSLKKDGLLHAYNKQIQEILDRGAAIKLSKEEMAEYQGPTQYISHHAVLKDSISTPVRMVTNSSFNNGGHSLNSCLAAGPNSLNAMLDVVLRFRCREVALQYDLSKAYNTMRTGLTEAHLRRWVWRFDEDSNWEDFCYVAVHFGDCCAATQLEVAKDLVADAGEYIDPEASSRIKDDTYVDDGMTGGTKEQVMRFLGSKSADGSFDGTFAQILGLGNFKMKGATFSGDTDKEMIQKLGGNVCGYGWNVTEDILSVKFTVNLSKKKRSVRSGPNLTLAEIDKLKEAHMCKRNLLGIVNSISDPLGIGSPWYLKLKLLMKKLFLLETPLSWDEAIPESNREEWIKIVSEALTVGVLPFPRSCRPENAIGTGPTVVGFGDGALPGFGGSIYLQWQVECCHTDGPCDGKGIGDFDSNLIMSKSRVCPLKGYTVPRSELCGALLTSRLLISVVKALQKLDEVPIAAEMILDSRCIISSLEMNSTKMMPFFQNRIAEIHENLDTVAKMCPIGPVNWIESKLNPADLCTRGTVSLEDIGPGSFHQKGPNFLCSSRDNWPVVRDFVPEEIPAEETRVKRLNIFNALKAKHEGVLPFLSVVDSVANYSNDLNKVHRVLARIIRGWRHKSKVSNLKITNPEALTLISVEPTREEMDKAKLMLLVNDMPATAQAFKDDKLSSLLPFKKGKLFVTAGRVGEANMLRLLGVDSLPILMSDTRSAFLYMYMAHRGESGLSNTAVEHHRAAVGTLARSRTYVWIVKGKSLAKKIVSTCFTCRRVKKQMESQLMGMLHEAHLTVSPPWTFVALDFAGPFYVAGEVQKRVTMKGWVLVYVDQGSRAICLLLTSGYGTQDFLMKHAEFCARKGIPRRIVSDRGSQLVAGSKVVASKDMPCNAYDWDYVAKQNTSTVWEFVPAGCQWRNNTEAMVKVLKTALKFAIPAGKVLSYSEMVTLLARIAFSVNSRPLGLAHTSSTSQQDDLIPLTPNQLLLGHNTAEKPDVDYLESETYSARLNYLKELHKLWWQKWIENVLPTLIPCRKWQRKCRNMQKGDVVLMRYAGNLVDDYRLGLITKVYPDARGIVKTVEVSYRKRDAREKPEVYKSKPLTAMDVGVQRLALIQAVGEDLPTGLE